MRPSSTLHRTTARGFRLGAAVSAALLLTACGGDGGSDAPEGAAPEVQGDAELPEDAEDIAEDAEKQLEDADVDTDSSDAYAEVVFRGETLRIPADDSFGCFITEDGGSDGAVDFTGADDAGNQISLGWAGDTPELSSVIQLTLADGSEWFSRDIPFEVTISGSTSAVVATTLYGFDGTTTEEADIMVRPICS